MSIIKRISTSLYSQIDGIVGEIENHDALIKAAITEQRKKLAAAKVQLSKIQRSEKSTARQLAELKQKEKSWAERAITTSDKNETQALACLQRRQSVRDQITKCNDALLAYQQTASKMSADIARCEQELKAMSQKHELMRARQSSVEAQNIFNEVSDSSIDELETSFNRWELKLAQGEIDVEGFDSTDTLEQEYISQENEQQLRAELADLLDKENNYDNI